MVRGAAIIIITITIKVDDVTTAAQPAEPHGGAAAAAVRGVVEVGVPLAQMRVVWMGAVCGMSIVVVVCAVVVKDVVCAGVAAVAVAVSAVRALCGHIPHSNACGIVTATSPTIAACVAAVPRAAWAGWRTRRIVRRCADASMARIRDAQVGATWAARVAWAVVRAMGGMGVDVRVMCATRVVEGAVRFPSGAVGAATAVVRAVLAMPPMRSITTMRLLPHTHA